MGQVAVEVTLPGQTEPDVLAISVSDGPAALSDAAKTVVMNSSDLRQASPALAAEFLHEFAGDGPWAHVDMAGPAFLERSRGDYLWQRGGTGFGVRLIVELARSLAG